MAGNKLFVEGYGASPQDPWTISSTQIFPLGTRGVLDDRSFRYARMSDTTAIGPNKLAQQANPEALHVSETGALTSSQGGSGGVFVSGIAVGATRIKALLGAAAAVADRYRDGYFKIQTGSTGGGQIFKVLGHAAAGSATTIEFEIAEPCVTVIPTGATWSLIHNPWADVLIQPTTALAPAAGVTMVNWPAATTAAPNFGWLQTWGIASCLGDATDQVVCTGMIQGAVAGALGVEAAAGIVQRVAYSYEAMATDGQYMTVFLMIAP